jgi:hypothetical protein
LHEPLHDPLSSDGVGGQWDLPLVAGMSRSSELPLERFEERYGDPPGVNVVVTGTGQGGSQLSQELGPTRRFRHRSWRSSTSSRR